MLKCKISRYFLKRNVQISLEFLSEVNSRLQIMVTYLLCGFCLPTKPDGYGYGYKHIVAKFNHVSSVHQRYRQSDRQTDGIAMTTLTGERDVLRNVQRVHGKFVEIYSVKIVFARKG